MRFLPWAALVLMACGPSRVEHPTAMGFGDVRVGASRSVALVLTNSGPAATQLTFAVDGDFSLEETSRTSSAGETTTLLVKFSPTGVGARSGTLSINGAQVALSGRGTGPRLSVPHEVVLAPIALLSGQPENVITSKILLRNTGTAGSLLHVSPAIHPRGELCVGTFVGEVCQPWSPPAEVDTQALVEVPLSVLASSTGARSWPVTFRSDDPIHPEVTTEVRARVDSFEPCRFSAPAEVVFQGARHEVTIKHLGPAACLVRGVSLMPSELRLLDPGSFPIWLGSGASFTVSFEVLRGAPPTFYGTIQVTALGTAPFTVPLRREVPGSNCLTLSPSTLDFGVARQGCTVPPRTFHLYDTCAEPIVIDSIRVGSGAGEGPGGPSCPGPAPCPEFVLTSAPPDGTVLQPGSRPVTFSVAYRPINYGPDTGAVVVTVRGGLQYVVALQGRGDAAGRYVDTYRSDPVPVTDVLVMVDPSPSFVPRRASARASLLPLLTVLGNACHDTRWAFAAADGAPDAGVHLLANDAGAVWTRSTEPAFIERALSAFDSLPVGSEVEACIGPAADLMEDAGVRTGARFAGMCVTDALEQSPNPMAALQRIQALGTSSWSAVAGVGSCGVEAIDDGVHLSLATAGNGSREDICDWAYVIGGFPCSPRTHYFLTSRPDGAIEVRVDGQLANDWTWDPTNNAVQFTPGREPRPGTTVEISYGGSCSP